MEHSAIYSKNNFEVPFDFISSQTIKGYHPQIPIQPTLDPSHTSSLDKEPQGVSSEKPLYLIPKT